MTLRCEIWTLSFRLARAVRSEGAQPPNLSIRAGKWGVSR